jgi:uncharacterized protein with HEPN domain
MSGPLLQLTRSMPFDIEQTALRDMRHHIDLATHFVAGLDSVAFRNDVYAVVRCLEIISEASRRVSDALKDRHPSIERWQMAAAGNVYRHNYEDVAAEYVWETVQRSLPPLRTAIEQELRDQR